MWYRFPTGGNGCGTGFRSANAGCKPVPRLFNRPLSVSVRRSVASAAPWGEESSSSSRLEERSVTEEPVLRSHPKRGVHLTMRRCFIVLCLAFTTIQSITAWTWGMPGYRSWAIDSVGGFQILGWAKEGMRYPDGFDACYPPVHKYVLAGVSAPVCTWYWATGRLHALEEATPAQQVSARSTFLRLASMTSIVMGVGIMILLFRLGNHFGGEECGLLAASLWSGTYLAAYYAQTSNLDVPYMFWFLLALERLLAFHCSGRLSVLIASAICAALSVGTKDQAAALILVFPCLLLWPPFPNRGGPHPTVGRAQRRLLCVWLAVAAVTYGIVSQALLRPTNYWNHLETVFGSALRPVQSGLGWFDLLIAYGREFLCSAHPLLLVVLAAGTVRLLVKSPRVFLWLTAPVVAFHVAFLGASGILASRFLLPHLTLMALMAGISAGICLRRLHCAKGWAVPVLAFLFHFSGFSLTLLLWHDPRARAERWFDDHPDVANSLATYCKYDEYLPLYAQLNAVRVKPIEGRPVEPIDEHLICVSDNYDRYLRSGDSGSQEAWRRLLSGAGDFEVLKILNAPSVPFPWDRINDCRPNIPGLAQTIRILRRKAVYPSRNEAVVPIEHPVRHRLQP